MKQRHLTARTLRLLVRLLELALLWQQGWRPRRTVLRCLGLPDKWHWRDPESGNLWVREVALAICERRLRTANT